VFRPTDEAFAKSPKAQPDALLAGAKATKTDIAASNGVIHVRDSVVLPKQGHGQALNKPGA